MPVVLALGLALGAVPATANHNADRHQNMDLLFEAGPTGATNSDMAFWGDRAYQANYDGVRIFDISNPAAPTLLGDFKCHGPQNDLVVWQNRLMFVGIDRTQTGPNCGSTDTAAHDDPNGWEGIRIFDVSNPASVQQIGSVYQDCGAHTITLWPKSKKELLLWTSSYPLRPGPSCGQNRGPATGRDPVHGVIQVVSVPVNNPAAAREIAEPKIVYPGDSDNVFRPEEHGLSGVEPAMRACHDIGVFVQLRLAAAACAEQAQLWRVNKNGIPQTQKPIWVYDDNVDETGVTGDPADKGVVVDFWHSATFSWDGSVVNFIDESFGAGCPTTTTAGTVDGDTGRMFFLDRKTGALKSVFNIARTETASYDPDGPGPMPPIPPYCSAHLGAPVLSTDRDLLVNAWYMGGVDVIDFTDESNPVEVAYYDQAPEGATGSDNWSAYWYENPASTTANGLSIYATDGIHNPSTGDGFESYRGNVQAKELTLPYFNPQTQELVPACKGRDATLVGSVLNDVLKGTSKRDVIVAGPGNDKIRGLGGNDIVCSGDGRDKVNGSAGKDRLYGEKQRDTLRGGSGNDRLVGGKGRDVCIGGSGVDVARGCEREATL